MADRIIQSAPSAGGRRKGKGSALPAGLAISWTEMRFNPALQEEALANQRCGWCWWWFVQDFSRQPTEVKTKMFRVTGLFNYTAKKSHGPNLHCVPCVFTFYIDASYPLVAEHNKSFKVMNSS